MRIRVSSSDGSPIYLQIFRQIQFLVGSGRLRAGEELPSIRSLAAQLVVNPNTVARAYRELESAGIVTKRGTSGTFVAEDGSIISARQRKETLFQRVETLLLDARQMGFSTKDVIKTLKECDSVSKPPA